MNCSYQECYKVLSFYSLKNGQAIQCYDCPNAFYCSDICRNLDNNHKQKCSGVMIVLPQTQSVSLQMIQFLEEIGQGSFGKVYKIKISEQIFALKRIKKSHCAKEIRIHKYLTHQNIIKFYQFLEDSDNVYIIMEYASKGSLTQNRGNCNLQKIILQLFDAIIFIHEKGIIHRDLKPDNILLDVNDNIKICDFGLATYEGVLSSFSGTFEFMAPEVVKNLPQTQQVDIWSIGAILYWLLEGKTIVEGNQVEKMQQLIEFQKPNFQKIENPLIQDCLIEMLNPDPEKRSTIKQILNHKWIRNINDDNFNNFDNFDLSTQPSLQKQQQIEIQQRICKNDVGMLQKIINVFGCGGREKSV